MGYDGGYTTLKRYVSPRRRRRQPDATVRFETAPGEQAQVDWGSLGYMGADGKKHRIWVFVMTLGWSRACYVELVRRADTAAFIQCHVNAFEYLCGVPRRCLYDNAKVVTLGKDETGRVEWNLRMLDFALRLGFEVRLCQSLPGANQGKGGERGQVRQGKHVAQHMLHRRCRPQSPGAGVVRRCGQRQGARDHPSCAVGDAVRGKASPRQAP